MYLRPREAASVVEEQRPRIAHKVLKTDKRTDKQQKMSTALHESGNQALGNTVRKVRKSSKGADADNLTVEEHLQQEYDEIENKVRANTNEKVQMLLSEYATLKAALLAAAGIGLKEPSYEVTIESLSGPHAGEKWVNVISLCEQSKKRGKKKAKKTKKSIPIGRSRHTKYTKGGVSLSKDDEVSTAHAEIILKSGQGLFLEDRGSTNGTRLDGTDIEAMTPVPIMDGQKIFFGGSTEVVVQIRTVE